MTSEVEARASEYIRNIDEMGGMVPAIEKGYPQREIAEASYQYQREVEEGRRTIVGVNRFQEKETASLDLLAVDTGAHDAQCAKLAALRHRRNNQEVRHALDELRRAAAGTANLMPSILDAVRAYATLGEICAALGDVFGTYQERSVL
jgi:methylmalonyl-CoA mutase N-terminal domain/subunit